jgi:hypothetical protein
MQTLVLQIPENTCVLIMPMPPVKARPREPITVDAESDVVDPTAIVERKTEAA